MTKNAINHYSVEGEPGTWTTHDSLDEAIARAKQIGCAGVWSIRYTETKSGQTGVEKRLVYSTEEG